MAIKNKSRYALLGVLSMKSCSGYDIKKFCDKTISHFWNENFGHIYPVLSELQKEGLISQVEQDSGGNGDNGESDNGDGDENDNGKTEDGSINGSGKTGGIGVSDDGINGSGKSGDIGKSGNGKSSRRKVYGITDKGREEFLEWLVQPIEYQPARSELLLKLSFGLQMPKEKVIEMLEAVKARNMEKSQQFKLLEQSYSSDEKARKHPQYIYWLAPLRYGIISSEAAASWCSDTIECLRNQESEE